MYCQPRARYNLPKIKYPRPITTIVIPPTNKDSQLSFLNFAFIKSDKQIKIIPEQRIIQQPIGGMEGMREIILFGIFRHLQQCLRRIPIARRGTAGEFLFDRVIIELGVAVRIWAIKINGAVYDA